jgi:N-acetylmuramoyl-L-alanine amidase
MKSSIINIMPAKRLIVLTGLCALGLFQLHAAALSSAQENGAVVIKVRAAGHGESVRIVITAEGAALKKSWAALDNHKVIVADLRQDMLTADKQKRSFRVVTGRGEVKEGASVEILKSVGLTLNGTALHISVPNVREIKVSRLQSPSRLVVDAYSTSAPRDDPGQTAALRPLADQLSARTFVIDAGHGGHEYGIRGARFSEKDFTLAFARDLAGVLNGSGRAATLVRKSDIVMTLRERIATVNKKIPDIFISFHVSSTKTPSVYTAPDREADGGKAMNNRKKEMSANIAEAIATSMEKEFSVTVARATLPLPLLTMTRSPAVVVELPNPDEFAYDKKIRGRMLSAILKGLSAGTRDDRAHAPAHRPETKPESPPAFKPVAKPVVKSDKRPESMPAGAPEEKARKRPEAKQGKPAIKPGSDPKNMNKED